MTNKQKVVDLFANVHDLCNRLEAQDFHAYYEEEQLRQIALSLYDIIQTWERDESK